MRFFKRIDLQQAWDDRGFTSKELVEHTNNLLYDNYRGEAPKVKSIKGAIEELNWLEFEIQEISKEEYEKCQD